MLGSKCLIRSEGKWFIKHIWANKISHPWIPSFMTWDLDSFHRTRKTTILGLQKQNASHTHTPSLCVLKRCHVAWGTSNNKMSESRASVRVCQWWTSALQQFLHKYCSGWLFLYTLHYLPHMVAGRFAPSALQNFKIEVFLLVQLLQEEPYQPCANSYPPVFSFLGLCFWCNW